ncbi:MAG: AtpZ/AtpI family protein [Patescibacteria group bacterium]
MMKEYFKNNKEIARAMFLYISFSVLGPLLVIGGIGYLIDRLFNTHFILILSILVAFIVSNVLMFKKLKKINKEIEKNSPKTSLSEEKKNSYDDEEDEWPISPSNK